MPFILWSPTGSESDSVRRCCTNWFGRGLALRRLSLLSDDSAGLKLAQLGHPVQYLTPLWVAKIEFSCKINSLDRRMEFWRTTSTGNTALVRAILTSQVDGLADWLEARAEPSAHQRLAAEDIRRWQRRLEGTTERGKPFELPPGSPIGRDDGKRDRF